MVAERDAQLRGTSPIEVLRWPDTEERQSEAVDLIARDSHGQVLAIEHTIIESYKDQIAEHKSLYQIFPAGGVHLPEMPNAAQYRLILRVEEVLGVRWGDRQAV